MLSAGSVLRALDPQRYDVVCVGVTPEGRWVLPAAAQPMTIAAGRLPEIEGGTALAVPSGRGLVVLEPGALPRVLADVDVVFPLLHGPFGEDGTVQGLLELAGVPYVGSGVFASAAAMDKGHAKTLLAAAALPVGPHVVLRPTDDPETAERLRLPVFVKPARAGSSMGISRVIDWSQLPSAVEVARRHDPKVLVEQGIEGRELEVGVLGGLDGGPPTASLAAEVRLVGGQEFYDFEAKYLDAATAFDVPASLSGQHLGEVRSLALRAFAALDCAGLARVDFFLTPRGDWVINEINTMPGFTAASMFPRVWAASGLPLPALVDRLVALALEAGTGLR